jgi:hypothetical protein
LIVCFLSFLYLTMILRPTLRPILRPIPVSKEHPFRRCRLTTRRICPRRWRA